MANITAYDNPLTSGKGLGLNTTGISRAGSVGPFDLVDFDKGVISDNGSVYKSVVVQEGITYSLAIGYSGFGAIVNVITLGINNQTVLAMTNLNLQLNDVLLYEGALALQNMLRSSDAIIGNSGPDKLSGWSGADSLYGQVGDDYLDGGEGNDFLSGGPGNDTLFGGGGFDAYNGGSGLDTVLLSNDSNDYALSRNPISGVVEILFKYALETEKVPTDIEFFQFRDTVISNSSSIPFIGTVSPEPARSVSSVYRFYNLRDKAFFYTNSPDERDMIISKSSPANENIDEWPYVFQGTTFEAAHTYSGAVPVFRFYNTQTGHHFFTVNKDEASYVRTMSSKGLWPFKDEGTAFNVYANDPTPKFVGQEAAVHRFYSTSLNRHFFTADPSEVDQIKLTGIWTYEGVAFFGELPGG